MVHRAQRRSARQRDRIDCLNGAGGVEEIGLPRAGPPAAYVHSGDKRRVEQNGRDPGCRPDVVRMADPNPGDVGEEIAGHKLAFLHLVVAF